jgi:hypothetical protein
MSCASFLKYSALNSSMIASIPSPCAIQVSEKENAFCSIPSHLFSIFPFLFIPLHENLEKA